MKTGIWAAVIAAGMLAVGCGKAGPPPLKNEPAGFGGIAWGTGVGKLPAGMVEDRISEFMRQTIGMRVFKKLKEDADLGGAVISKVQYGFYKDRFYLVSIEFRGPENFGRIERALAGKHGRGAEEKEANALSWIGEKVDILLVRSGTLMYVYKPIDEEKLKDEKDTPARVRNR